MYHLSLFALCISSIAAAAKFGNPSFDGLSVGTPFEIKWIDASGPVTVKLKSGSSTALKDVSTIGLGLTGSSFSWTPQGTSPSELYALEITDATGINYSVQFPISGAGGSVSSAATDAIFSSPGSSSTSLAVSVSSSLPTSISVPSSLAVSTSADPSLTTSFNLATSLVQSSKAESTAETTNESSERTSIATPARISSNSGSSTSSISRPTQTTSLNGSLPTASSASSGFKGVGILCITSMSLTFTLGHLFG